MQRIISAIWSWVVDAYARIVRATPGGAIGLLVIIVLLALGVFLLVRRRGVSNRVRRGDDTSLELAADQSSDELRSEADALAARGEWAASVRARLRAVVRTLEERGVLSPRPGRTAAEAAAEAGRERPDLSEMLWMGAVTFGEIWYGKRTATAGDDQVLRELDVCVRRRPSAVQASAHASTAAGGMPAPPR